MQSSGGLDIARSSSSLCTFPSSLSWVLYLILLPKFDPNPLTWNSAVLGFAMRTAFVAEMSMPSLSAMSS